MVLTGGEGGGMIALGVLIESKPHVVFYSVDRLLFIAH